MFHKGCGQLRSASGEWLPVAAVWNGHRKALKSLTCTKSERRHPEFSSSALTISLRQHPNSRALSDRVSVVLDLDLENYRLDPLT